MPEIDGSVTRWNAQETAWKQELPNLPDEMIALLAVPLRITASTWPDPDAALPASRTATLAPGPAAVPESEQPVLSARAKDVGRNAPFAASTPPRNSGPHRKGGRFTPHPPAHTF